jgi:hypothetical protein
LANYLINKKLTLWNLYQFWYFDFMSDVDRFFLSDAEFSFEVGRIEEIFGTQLDIRGGLLKERERGYFFVTSRGESYTVCRTNPHHYVFLGSIFQPDIYDRWLEHNCVSDCDKKVAGIVNREIGQSRC